MRQGERYPFQFLFGAPITCTRNQFASMPSCGLFCGMLTRFFAKQTLCPAADRGFAHRPPRHGAGRTVADKPISIMFEIRKRTSGMRNVRAAHSHNFLISKTPIAAIEYRKAGQQ